MTRTTRHLLSGVAILIMVGCTPIFQDEAWEKVCGNLKAPSTARIAEFKTHAVSDAQRKAFYLLTLTEIKFPFTLRKTLDTRGTGSMFSLKCILEGLPKDEAATLIAKLRAAAPSQDKALDDCEAKKASDLLFQDLQPTKREISACIKILEGLIRVVAARELSRFNAISSTVEARNIFITYDAQNSYGAMIRGTAHFYGVSVGSSKRVLDTDVDFDFGLAGLPEEKMP